MIRYEFVYVYFIAIKNVGDYSYMSSPNIYYRAPIYLVIQEGYENNLGFKKHSDAEPLVFRFLGIAASLVL